MLYMVIEQFRSGDPLPVRQRFVREGRMLPDGVEYLASWIDPARARCFQLMDATSPALMDVWVSRWLDLVEFEVVPVQTSADYWAAISTGR